MDKGAIVYLAPKDGFQPMDYQRGIPTFLWIRCIPNFGLLIRLILQWWTLTRVRKHSI